MEAVIPTASIRRQPKKQPSTAKGCLLFIVGLIVFAGVVTAIADRTLAPEETPFVDGSDGAAVPSESTPSDSVAAAEQVCRSLVEDKLTSPTEAKFGRLTMKRDVNTKAFVGRGEVTAPNPVGVPITNRFVCAVDPDGSGKGNAIFRSSNPEMYDEMVRLFDL